MRGGERALNISFTSINIDTVYTHLYTAQGRTLTQPRTRRKKAQDIVGATNPSPSLKSLHRLR